MQGYTVTLPPDLYKKLQRQAKTTRQSLDHLVEETLQRSLPPPVEATLPESLQNELKAMESLSDNALWAIGQSVMNPDKVAMYDALLERNREGTLTPEGCNWLTDLRHEADALMLRKAQAYLILQSRGRKLPTLAELEQTMA